MTDVQKAARLRMAIDALLDAESWVQQALGETDVGCDYRNRLRDLVNDLRLDIAEFEMGLI